jgi:hypothetical protein
MSEPIIGLTVGTPINPKILKPTTTEIEAAVANYLEENPVEGQAPIISASPTPDGTWIAVNGEDICFIPHGQDGDNGVGIYSIERTSGTGAPGTTDTYTITLTDNRTSIFTVYNGKDGAKGDSIKGDPGERGYSILRVTTALSSYTTAVGGFTPKYRIALPTVLEQSGASEVRVGDTILRNYYTYHVGYVDGSYVYVGAYASIRGSAGTSVTISSTTESEVSGGENVVTFSDDKTLTIKNGRDGENGLPGDDGYTPVKGVDYDTPEDRAEIEAYIATELAKRGQLKPEFANDISECEDETKLYVLPDGYIYAYMKAETATVGGWSENLVPTSIDTDGSIFNGKGYKDGTRLNSSGVVTTQNDSTSIGFIPCKKGDKFRITGVYFGHSQNGPTVYAYISIYNASKTKIISASYDTIANSPSSYPFTISPLKTSGGVSSTDVTEIDFANASSDVAFVRFSSAINATGATKLLSGADMVVQKWTEGGTEITEGWNNTGLAFVPADYEGDILKNKADIANLNKKSLEHEERIANLEENGLSGSASNIIPEGLEWLNGYPIPQLILNGSTDGMTKDNEVSLTYECKDKDGNTKTGSCTMKWQGSSSIAYEKKNYTIKFDNAFEVVSGWGSQKKYCLKANFIDHSHARNVVSAKLWGQVVKSRASVDSRLSALPNAGAVDGFPIIIILNGEFHGLYTWNIPKDGWMFGMSGTTAQQAIVCADKYVDATAFKALAVLDGSDFELEYSSDEQSEWVKTSLNRMLQTVINSNGSDLDTTISQYLDIDSAIDYIIHTVLIEAADCVQKNYLLATYDGVKWFFSAYDMDSTFGLHWHGKDFSSLTSTPTFQTWKENKLMNLLLTKKRDAINARYEYLRANALSEPNVAKTFWNFGCLIPKPILLKDVEKWTSIPSTSVNDIHQILTQYRLRCMLADEWIEE